eukprot:g16162.t1
MFPQSVLAAMFSGRWESSLERDPQGNYFLDFDAADFAILLTYLRDKRIERPERPAPIPVVPAEKLEHFDNLLSYLGLKDQVPTAKSSAGGGLAGRGREQLHATTSGGGIGGAVASAFDRFKPTMSNSKSTEASTQPEGAPPTAARFEDGLVATEDGTARGRLRSRATLLAVCILGIARHGPHFRGRKRRAKRVESDTSAGIGRAVDNVTSRAVEAGTGMVPAIRTSNDYGGVCKIPDTRANGCASAVRATRGFNRGTHAWQITIGKCSDYSFIGFVDDSWNHFQDSIGKSAGSWGIASNGALHVRKLQQEGSVSPYRDDSTVQFIVDMDKKVCQVTIDGTHHENLFTNLPAVVYPAVSNCRSPAEYKIDFGLG